jgi:phosphoesterase RecJ-like protein
VTVASPPAGSADAIENGLAGQAERAAKLLVAASQICLACHVRPDGDALGSMLAVAHALRQRRGPAAEVVASFGDRPFSVPRILRFLPGVDLLTPPGDYPERPEVMVAFDAASPDRLGPLAASAARAGELIVLDHHASNTGFGSVRVVDPAAAATAVLAADLIRRLDAPITADIAVCLYAGLATDTGSFRYAATTAAVHRLAATLLEAGVDAESIAQELWDRAPFSYLGLLSAALGRAVLEPEQAAGHGLVWTVIDQGDLARCGLALEAAEPVIDAVRRVDEADVAVVLKEDDTGHWLVSVRSKGQVDVGRACAALGGGGHPRAAGFTSTASLADTIAALRRQLATGLCAASAGEGRSVRAR